MLLRTAGFTVLLSVAAVPFKADEPGRFNLTRRNACEVVVLGVDHVYYGEGYRPAHLRAFFEAVRPTAMAIENPPSFQARGEFRSPLLESREAVAYAGAHKIPVYGVDVEISQLAGSAPARVKALPRLPGLSPEDARLLGIRSAFDEAATRIGMFGDYPRFLEFMNGADFGDYLRSGGSADRLPGWDQWNAAILTNIRAAAAQLPGGRLLVVYGSLHKPVLDAGLAGTPNVALRQPADWFPLGADVLARHDRPDDLKLMFRLVTDQAHMLSHRERIRPRWYRSQLPALESLARSDLEARYSLARWLAFEGQFDQAAVLLRQVADAAEADTLPWDPRDWGSLAIWPPEPNLRRRSLFALALSHDQAGRRDSAVAIYAALKKEVAAPATPAAQATTMAGPSASPLTPWLNLFLAEPYTGHADQYLKGFVR